MNNKREIRLRFAPSPTGGLHLGGIRTLIYNYLFAKKYGGKLILRIEDTDQKRLVSGAEQYIFDCCKWLGITLDESPKHAGNFGPYKQSERKNIYRQHLQTLIKQGLAYYAFDTTEELDSMRENIKHDGEQVQYDSTTRMLMNNSLTIGAEETQHLLDNGTPYVIRIKVPKDEKIIFKDALRGDIIFESNLLDDKVLMKADGLPTYHFAVVVDDYLMKISHVLRGEEWLPSAPIHQLLWQYLGWQNDMPTWVHLPLILKPDGNGKLSKRDSQRLGIPIYAIQWKDPINADVMEGFKEKGFLPEAIINFLTLISWNDGTGQEIFNIEDLIKNFTLERLHHHSAKFNYEKAIWYNHSHIQKLDEEILLQYLKKYLQEQGIINTYDDKIVSTIINASKDRCHFINDFYDQNIYLFKAPESYDTQALQGKWTDNKKNIFIYLINALQASNDFSQDQITQTIQTFCTTQNIKLGDIQLPLRIILVGGKFGIGVMQILSIIGKDESIKRIQTALRKIETTG